MLAIITVCIVVMSAFVGKVAFDTTDVIVRYTEQAALTPEAVGRAAQDAYDVMRVAGIVSGAVKDGLAAGASHVASESPKMTDDQAYRSAFSATRSALVAVNSTGVIIEGLKPGTEHVNGILRSVDTPQVSQILAFVGAAMQQTDPVVWGRLSTRAADLLDELVKLDVDALSALLQTAARVNTTDVYSMADRALDNVEHVQAVVDLVLNARMRQ